MNNVSMFIEFEAWKNNFKIHVMIGNRYVDCLHIEYSVMKDCSTERIVDYYSRYYVAYVEEIRHILAKTIKDIKRRIYE